MSTEHARPGGSAAGQPGDLPSDPVAVPPQEEPQATEPRERRTRISAAWVGILVAIVVLVLLLIFILENLRDVNVTYLGASGQLPLGVALLFAAIGGALMVAMAGVARLTQLRLHARQRRHARAHHRSQQDH